MPKQRASEENSGVSGPKIDFRLNPGNPMELVILDYLTLLRNNNRGSDFIKACLYERITGLSWVDNRPLSGATPMHSELPGTAAGGPRTIQTHGSDYDNDLVFDDDNDWAAGARGA